MAMIVVAHPEVVLGALPSVKNSKLAAARLDVADLPTAIDGWVEDCHRQKLKYFYGSSDDSISQVLLWEVRENYPRAERSKNQAS